MAATAGYLGGIYVTATPSVSLSSFVLTDSGDHQTFTTPTGQQAKRYWDKTQSFVVQTSTDGGTTWTTAAASTYTIQYVGGIVTLSAPLAGTPACQLLSGFYFAYSQLAQASKWDLTIDGDLHDVTVFSTAPWRTLLPGMRKSTGTFEQFFVDGTYLGMLGALMVFLLFTDKTTAPAGPRYEGYGYLKQDQVKDDMKAVVIESMGFEVDGHLYYLAN